MNEERKPCPELAESIRNHHTVIRIGVSLLPPETPFIFLIYFFHAPSHISFHWLPFVMHAADAARRILVNRP